MFLRALKICSPDFIDQEIKFIYNIARDHQYPEHLIGDAYHRAIKSHHNSNVSRDPIQNVLTLPFHRPLLPLVNIFKHHFNINIVVIDTRWQRGYSANFGFRARTYCSTEL